MKTKNTHRHDENDFNGDSGGSPPNAADRFRTYTVAEVIKRPFPGWLVKGLLPSKAFTMIYGDSGSAKSFIALELAFHVAAGQPWRGHKVKHAPVVYVAAEGQDGIGQRVIAFLQRRGWKAPDNLHFIFDAPELMNKDDIPALAKRIRALGVVPGLIVIDTFARCFHGDENSSGEIGAAIREVEKLRASCGGATVLLVHHSTKGQKKTYRGSSALKGALDSMIAVDKTGETIEVGIEKQKDAKQAKGLKLKLEEVPLPHIDCFGDPITSCVLVGDGQADTSFDVSDKESHCLLVLSKLGGSAVQNADWERAVRPVVPKNSFDHLKTPMKDKGWIMDASASGATKRWMLTPEGEEVVRFIQSKGKAETATASSEAAGPAPSPSTSSDGTLAVIAGGMNGTANR